MHGLIAEHNVKYDIKDSKFGEVQDVELAISLDRQYHPAPLMSRFQISQRQLA